MTSLTKINQHFFFSADSKTRRVFWGFEQLSSTIAWRVMELLRHARNREFTWNYRQQRWSQSKQRKNVTYLIVEKKLKVECKTTFCKNLRDQCLGDFRVSRFNLQTCFHNSFITLTSSFFGLLIFFRWESKDRVQDRVRWPLLSLSKFLPTATLLHAWQKYLEGVNWKCLRVFHISSFCTNFCFPGRKPFVTYLLYLRGAFHYTEVKSCLCFDCECFRTFILQVTS